ncbi:MAG TPA: hypothetical protein PK981_09345 [Accumulibacter sp.]|nr:hypothetical protein [Accumulibacter sp.]HNG39235.1 hypothetical protein [Accumulibacter sp.]HNK01534.1 hypothetical protein [Accumulibacter sp.]HNL14887.1 hypothetical protein [Accumulibacter sp.]
MTYLSSTAIVAAPRTPCQTIDFGSRFHKIPMTVVIAAAQSNDRVSATMPPRLLQSCPRPRINTIPSLEESA